MLDCWRHPDPLLTPEPGGAHVFRLRLDLAPAQLAPLSALLDEAERARAARYLPENSRRQFTAARGQMRQVLGALLHRSPQDLRVTTGAYGKPALAGDALRFNLSHSGGLALLAVTLNQDAGVDIEAATRKVDFEKLAPRFFAPAEAAALAALPSEQQPAAFFKIWTRKEAYIKACGVGLALPLHSFTVSLDDPPSLSVPGWSIRALDPGPTYTGALVVAGQILSLHTWDWPAPPG